MVWNIESCDKSNMEKVSSKMNDESSSTRSVKENYRKITEKISNKSFITRIITTEKTAHNNQK